MFSWLQSILADYPNIYADGTGRRATEPIRCTEPPWTLRYSPSWPYSKGHALFHPDNGETIEIKAGDTVYFDNNSKGTWEVLETTRKAYLTYKRD
ncbi:MAG: DUF861 domain-containing protein [Gammaproteobacteria bacterium]|jgi:uncharacterized cupin superfamily protein|nr:DUF861 domain-containing protein [Gammaproteobacteria bacterium]